MDAGQLSRYRIAAKIPSLLWRRFQSRMPYGLRKIYHHQGGRRRTLASSIEIVFEGRRREASRFKIPSKARQRPALQGLRFVPRIFSWRHRPRGGRIAPNRLDGVGGETPSAKRYSGQ